MREYNNHKKYMDYLHLSNNVRCCELIVIYLKLNWLIITIKTIT